MAFDQQPLERTPPPPSYQPPPAGGSSTGWIVLVGLVVVAGAGLAYWWMTRSQPDALTLPPTVATDGALPRNRPQRQPWELPALDGSDSFFRDAVAALSANPALARLLATDGLVRGAVLAVEQIGEGRTPALPLKVLRPATRLAITGTDSGAIDPATFSRWDGPTRALTSIRPTDAAQVYVNVKPLFDSAYADLGHPGGDFDDSISRALSVLLATPEPIGTPELLRRPSYFEHTDAGLRSLRPVQKQVLLTGPENQRLLMAWLRALATALDIPAR
jgi:hypothetical protein